MPEIVAVFIVTKEELDLLYDAVLDGRLKDFERLIQQIQAQEIR
jgi:hypothetical protein